jgi:hypothetical protein
MNKKIIYLAALLAAAIAIAAVAANFHPRFTKDNSRDGGSKVIRTESVASPTTDVKDTDLPEYNFSRKGVAIKENARYNGENLFILYEEPGKPALRARLKFDGESICGDEKQTIVCLALSVSDYGLSSGRKIEVRGIESDGVVSVRRLIRLD